MRKDYRRFSLKIKIL